MKYVWLAYDIQKPYYGNAAFTSPVKKFFARNYGLTNPTQSTVNEVTFKLAHELDMDPLDVNTAMWILGKK